MLDVAAGTGNASLPAAAGAVVTALDLTPEMLATGKAPRAGRRLELDWIEGDSEHLPTSPSTS